MDDLRGLRHFVEVARLSSFTAAAERLSLTTAALSQSVASLEKRLGVRLFARTTRRVHLTGEGQTLYQELVSSFDSIDSTLDQISASSSHPSGTVRISTVTAYGKHCLLPLLPEFFQLYPDIELFVSFHDGARGMSRQPYDIRINWGEHFEQGKIAQRLCIMPLVLVASPDYLRKHGTPKHPDDLARHECITVALQNGSRGRWIFQERGKKKHGRNHIEITPKGHLIVADELDAVADAARLGMGVTVMSADCILDELRDGTLVRVMHGYDVSGSNQEFSEITIQYPARKSLTPKVRSVVDFLLDRLRDKNPLDSLANPPA